MNYSAILMLLITSLFALSGLTLGSFSNVIIHRMPLMQEGIRNITLCYPSSHCPACRTRLRVRDNIPMLSYILNGGECAHCHSRIPLYYFLVELLTVFFYVAIWLTSHNCIMQAVTNCLMASFFIIIAVIDIRHQKIYNVTLISLLVVIITGLMQTPERLLWGGVCMGVVYLFLFSFSMLMTAVLGKTALGLGDVKYLTVISVWSGMKGVLIILFTACGLTLLVTALARFYIFRESVTFTQNEGGTRIPFGPGISAACLGMLFFQSYIDSFLN